MRRLIPLILALWAAPALPAAGQSTEVEATGTLTVTVRDCKRLLVHAARSDVKYKPGVDVRDRKVAPADYPGDIKLKLPDNYAFDITVDIRRFMGGPAADKATAAGTAAGTAATDAEAASTVAATLAATNTITAAEAASIAAFATAARAAADAADAAVTAEAKATSSTAAAAAAKSASDAGRCHRRRRCGESRLEDRRRYRRRVFRHRHHPGHRFGHRQHRPHGRI